MRHLGHVADSVLESQKGDKRNGVGDEGNEIS